MAGDRRVLKGALPGRGVEGAAARDGVAAGPHVLFPRGSGGGDDVPQAFAERWYGAVMSLDAATGVLTYDDGAQVDPSKPLAEFLTTPLGGSATRRHRDTWTWLELPARAIDGVAFVATLTFEGERLFSILLNRARPRRDWDQWSLAEEQAIVAEDTRWLAAAVGEGRHQFTWGTVGAGFDERGATAYLLLRYQR